MITKNGKSGRVPEMWDPGEYREGKIRVSTGEGKIRVSTEKGRIQASTGKVEICASTENGESGRVPKIWDPGEYREGKIRVSTEKGKSL